MIGGLLSTIKAHFSNIQSEIQKIESMQLYDRAQEMMDEACDEIRRISHDLMPGVLWLEGLESAAELFARDRMTLMVSILMLRQKQTFHAIEPLYQHREG